jgi:hypothetical protein
MRVPFGQLPCMIPKWSRARHLLDFRKNSPPHRRRSPGRSRTISSISANESRCPSRSTHPQSVSEFIVVSAFNDCLTSIPLCSDLRFFHAVREYPVDQPVMDLFTGMRVLISCIPCRQSHAGTEPAPGIHFGSDSFLL